MKDARCLRVFPTTLILSASLFLIPSVASGQTAGADSWIEVDASFYEVPAKALRGIANLEEAELDKLKKAKLIAQPRIAILDGQEAEVAIVTEIPVRSTTVTEQAAIGTTEFREVGLIFHIAPRAIDAGGNSGRESPAAQNRSDRSSPLIT